MSNPIQYFTQKEFVDDNSTHLILSFFGHCLFRQFGIFLAVIAFISLLGQISNSSDIEEDGISGTKTMLPDGSIQIVKATKTKNADEALTEKTVVETRRVLENGVIDIDEVTTDRTYE